MGKYGEEGNQLIFKILKRGRHEKTASRSGTALMTDRAARPCRGSIPKRLPKFFKRYQIQPVGALIDPRAAAFASLFNANVDVWLDVDGRRGGIDRRRQRCFGRVWALMILRFA